MTLFMKTLEEIDIRVKCPYCGFMFVVELDLKKCICVWNPEIQKYKITYDVTCCKCGRKIRDITITVTKKDEEWEVS